MVGKKLDPELFRLSRDYVGDTAETIALVWPDAGDSATSSPPPLRGREHSWARGESL